MKKRIAFLLTAALISAPALATDFTKPLLDETGKPYQRCAKFDEKGTRCEDLVDVSLGRMIFDALNISDPAATPTQIKMRGSLALKIIGPGGSDLSLDDEQRDIIKSALFAASAKLNYTPVATVRALAIIDPASVKEK